MADDTEAETNDVRNQDTLNQHARPKLRIVSSATRTEEPKQTTADEQPSAVDSATPEQSTSPPPRTPKRTSILATERDFIKLFVYHMGENEIPQNFLEWGAVSLIASCLAERTYQNFLGPNFPLYPNLYVFLLASSGTGKGVTCDTVTSFLPTREHKVATGFEESRTTAQGAMDRLAKRFEKKGSLLEYLYGDRRAQVGPLSFLEIDEEDEAARLAAQHRLYLVFEELAASVGSGPRAAEFTKFITKTYGGKGYVDRTRTYGEIDFSGLVSINLLAGSTHRWMRDSISLDDILGGFFARVAVVDGDSQKKTKRLWRPRYPHDRDAVRQHLERRVTEMLQLTGEFFLTSEAEELGERWYLERPAPEDPVLEPIFQRERATMLKLAHVFAVAEIDGRCDFKIHSRHILRAQEAIRNMSDAVLRVVANSSVTQDTRGLLELKEFIQMNGPVSTAAVARYATSLGIGADQQRRILSILSDTGDLEKISSGADGTRRLQIRKKSWSLADIDDTDVERVANGGMDNVDQSDDLSSRDDEVLSSKSNSDPVRLDRRSSTALGSTDSVDSDAAEIDEGLYETELEVESEREYN